MAPALKSWHSLKNATRNSSQARRDHESSPQSRPRPVAAARSLEARLLQGFSAQDKDAILSAASYRRFTRNYVATQQGNAADQLFLLIKGSARYFFITPTGRKVYLLWLTPGEIFGVASLLTRATRFTVSAEVEKDSEVLVWERDTIRDLARRYPLLMENALSIASDYLVWYVATHLSLICHSSRRRLAHVLVSLACGFGQKVAYGISLTITNEELANTANITHFTVSRLLSEWHRGGLIVKSRGKILLMSPERLFHTPVKRRIHGLSDLSASREAEITNARRTDKVSRC